MARKVYFSHSYRDIEINTYFFGVLVEQEFELFADQKSPTWCVAKLERYLQDLSGFLSIVPRRTAEDGSITYSPYIGYELSLARRSGVPRLMFVDDEVLNRYREHFPRDVIPFVRSAPGSDRFRHAAAVSDFRKALESRDAIQKRKYRDRSVVVVNAGGEKPLSQTADALMDVLQGSAYDPMLVSPKRLRDALTDVQLFEDILNSEMCVFLLSQKVTNADVLLAIAYAHSVPSIRLQYDPQSSKVEVSPKSGRLCWSNIDDMLVAFGHQVDKYRKGFVQAVSTTDVRSIGITDRKPRPEQLWDASDGPALLKHIEVTSPRIRDTVNVVRKLVGGSFVNADPLEICTLLYGAIGAQHFAYEHEPPTLTANTQAIRTADDIWNDNAGTCIDLACLFAALLKVASLDAIILVLARQNFAHALVGYRKPGAPSWAGRPEIGDIRGAVVLKDIVLFEPTGVAESEAAVGGELAQERRDGNRILDFATANHAAERLINSQVELRHAVEIR